MKTVLTYFVALLACISFSCSPTRYVKPLEKGQHCANASFGGPMIGFAGAVIPIPLTSLGYGYGLDSNTTAYANLHTTAMLYGTYQMDIGINRMLYRSPSGFGITGNISVMMSVDKWEHQWRAWPLIDLNAYKNIGTKGSYMYGGFGNWFEFSKYRAHQQVQTVHWIFDPHLGYIIHRSKWKYQFESRFIAPNIANRPNVVEFKGIGGKGAVGVYFGIYKTF
jgi:hypothetical protein